MAHKYLMGLVGQGAANDTDGNDTELQIWGLYHVVGLTVSAFINGADCGDFTVAADGSITVPLYPTTPTTALDLATLIAADGSVGEQDCPVSLVSGGVTSFITLPIVVGVNFVSQGQLLRPATQEDIRSPSGGALGKKRRAHHVGVLVRESVLVQFGTSLSPSPLGNMLYANFSTIPDETAFNPAVGSTFSGVYWVDINDSTGYDSMICWQQDRPWPTTICAISAFLEAGSE